MKNITRLLLLFCLILVSCETENIEEQEELVAVEHKARWGKKKKVIKRCVVENADRCPFDDRQPASNFWWPEEETDYFNPATYFSTTDRHRLVFTEYDDGTAKIKGSVTNGSCTVYVKVWLKDRKSWAEWSGEDGGHKKEGCAGDASISEDMNFYVIDSEKSIIYAKGGDCISEGYFGLTQRPDPENPNTPNYGVHVGPGGANYHSDAEARGLSTWGWITDKHTGERLWVMDFNFVLKCKKKKKKHCRQWRCKNGRKYHWMRKGCRGWYSNYHNSGW